MVIVRSAGISSCQPVNYQPKTMITYTLSWPADNDEFVNLDDARDVAFEVSLETGALVEIYQNFGAASIVVETVNA